MTRVVLAVFVLAAAAVLVARCPEVTAERRPAAAAAPTPPSSVADAIASELPTRAAAEPSDQRAKLTIDVRGSEAGIAYSVQDANPWRLALPLLPELGMATPPATATRYSSGTVVVPLSATAWTWVRVADAGSGRSRYSLHAPSTVDVCYEITFAAVDGAIHVFLAFEDSLLPIPGCDVHLFRRDLRSAAIEPLATTRTNEAGYAKFAVPGSGTYVFYADGVEATVGDPWVGCVVVGTQSAQNECVQSIVLPVRRTRVELAVDGAFAESIEPFLYFRRFSSPPGMIFPITTRLTRGQQLVTTELAAGDYELGVLPVGRFRLVPAAAVYSVTGERFSAGVRITAQPASVEVSLRGIPDRRLPLTVRPVKADVLYNTAERQFFFGPYRWFSFKEAVGALEGQWWLVAESRKEVWISKGPTDLSRATVEVDMVPATRLHVSSASDDPDLVAFLDVQSSAWTKTLALDRELRAGPAGRRIVLEGEIVVPSGAVRLRCWDSASGAELWREDCLAEGKVVRFTR